MTLVSAKIDESPSATPISAVTNGTPAMSSDPKEISSTKNATMTPICSPAEFSLSLVLTTPPENSTCSPAARAGPATRSNAFFVESLRSSTETEKWRWVKPTVLSREGVKPLMNCSPVVTACGTFCARSTVGSTTFLYCGSSSVWPFGAANTSLAVAPPLPGNFSSSRSRARCDSVPGTLNASFVSFFTAWEIAPTATSSASQKPSTNHRRR